jgi:predicted peptidase
MTSRPKRRPGLTIAEVATVVALLALMIALVVPGPQEHGFVERVYRDSAGIERKYVLFVPWEYRGDQRYPAIVFLHGAGDDYRVTEVGLGWAIRKSRRERSFPFFVLFARVRELWNSETPDARSSVELLEEVKKNYLIDDKQIYLTGLSNGGTGTWYQAAKYPDLWAAIVPIAGRPVLEVAPQIKHIPCWCFHGDNDPSALVEECRQMIQALRDAGGNPRYTEFKGYKHNVWDRAYADPALYKWLLQQKRR